MADRFGTRPISVIGLAVTLAGFLALSTLTTETTTLGFMLRYMPLGIGIGFFQSPNNSEGAPGPGEAAWQLGIGHGHYIHPRAAFVAQCGCAHHQPGGMHERGHRIRLARHRHGRNARDAGRVCHAFAARNGRRQQ